MLYSIFEFLFFIIVAAFIIVMPIGVVVALIHLAVDAFSGDIKVTYKRTKEQKQLEKQQKVWKRNMRYMK